MIEFSANDDDPTSGTRGANSEVGTHLRTVRTMLANRQRERQIEKERERECVSHSSDPPPSLSTS